uniref:Uncharacterized protein n=1 Tax=Timema cristinae TaxID=61476 RepID=A0A7R9D9Y4_TIMCR|nr:unnamed protein product [Timema cristinae]
MGLDGGSEYSWELEQTLRSLAWQTEILSYSHLEQTVVSQFSDPALGRRWRQGIQRTSFTYLLLDSSVTCNLPERRAKLPQSQVWATFLASIFYVGKGKRARPFAHLYQAANIWGQATTKADKKVKRILKIWNCGLGVVCLHIFQNIIPAEAFTREAAMLDALGLANLCNTRGGEYYGVAATWSARQKKQLGIYFLYRAMMVFLNEGERQLRPTDICTP